MYEITAWDICIFWRLIYWESHHLWTFSLLLQDILLLLLFAYGFLCCEKAFKFSYILFVCRYSYFYYSRRWSHKNIATNQISVQDGGVEVHVLISSARAPKFQLAVEQPLTGECCNSLKKKKKKDNPRSKTKNKLQWECRRGTNMIKSNPVYTGWAMNKLENNNTKEVFPLLWRFWAPHQRSQAGDLEKRLGIPREYDFGGQWNLIIGFSQDWGKETPL